MTVGPAIPDLAPGWDEHRPGSAGATIGTRPDTNHDPYSLCEGQRFDKVSGLSTSQRSRLNSMLRKRGCLSACTHDLGRGVTLEQLLGGDGDYKSNALYLTQTPPPVDGLAALR